jgi:hypothetical protein
VQREDGTTGWEEARRGKGKKKMVGPTFGGGFGGPPRMEGERVDLEGHAKWRLV